MATYYSQGTGDWSTVANWDTNSGGGGDDPADVADMDDDTFIIQAGHTITFDCDMSGFANGIAGLTITGGGTPGMLVCESGGDGTYHLMIKTGTHITGTTDTNRGRLLANSDEVWGNTGALPNGRKFIIDLQGTAQIQATHLDIALYCTNPTNPYVRCYGTKYTFNASTAVDTASDEIDFGEAPPAAGTDVMLITGAGATLPTGLYENRTYYVRSVTGDECKLATTNSDNTIINITAVGSNHNCYMVTEQASATTTLNVHEDVTSDTPWTTTDGHDHVVLVNAGAPSTYDQQRVTLVTINAASIVISVNVDSAQYAGARLYLSSRNISIRSAGTSTSQAIVLYGSGDTHDGVFQCEIRNTAGSGTTFYGYGIEYGSGHTISGTISGCARGIQYGSGHTISGTISGCSRGIYYGSGHTISGTISGCTNEFYFPVGDIIIKPGGDADETFTGRGNAGYRSRISWEHYGGTLNAYKVIDNVGDIIKTACDATGDAPSEDPDAGNGDCIEASNIQSICDTGCNKLVIFDKHRIWMTAAQHTVTYKIQTTYAGIAEGGLKLTVSYISDDATDPIEMSEQTDSSAITQRSDDTDWTQTLAVTFTPDIAGWVDFKMELMEYESGNEVYVWPTPAIT